MPILCCKRELQNLCTTDGCAGKALCVGERHHVAWCFPTLNSCMLVDCLNLPVVVNDSIVLVESLVDDSNMVSCRLYVGDTDINQVKTRKISIISVMTVVLKVTWKLCLSLLFILQMKFL